MDEKACAATPHDELIQQLLDSRVAKTERERAAAREIERLRAERDALRAKLDSVRDVAVLMLGAIRLIEEGKPLPIEYMTTKLRATINAAIRGEGE